MAGGPSFTVVAKLDDDPRYVGTTHEKSTARRLGFRAALIPGAFVYGYISHLAVETWGMDWIERGSMSVRFRRPVYDGDVLAVSAGAFTVDTDGSHTDVSVRNGAGEEVATGSIGLPDTAPPPSGGELPVLPVPEPRVAVEPGGMLVGARTGTRNLVHAAKQVADSLAAFQETDPIYVEAGVVHSGYLMRIAMADINLAFRYPQPVILVGVETQHLAPARPGQRLATSAVVAETFERKGRHYFVSDETVLADGQPVAHMRRTHIYA